MKSLVGSIISLVIGFAFLNGLLWAGQEIYHYNDVKRCESLKSSLVVLENKINYQKNQIESNRSNYQKRNLDIETYHGMIDNYNAMVNEYNTLSKSAYNRWYLIPIPGFHGSSHIH